ncbi:peptidase S41 family protein-like protein [Hyaloscypha variabilis F]|uniref:Peptidase S41 family protein-like protein n=1 Tax=Hyaloscypha variabilis (strain UAMH 11265 / GT02V1 / F) TaxID=1149755 RepID=A0A2J6S6I2_HYAVF|nr:peptidase S41 family protein-like protein [Hyaloscypha variabilis F]
MNQLSLIFQLLCLSLVSVSTALPSLTKRASSPESTACGDVVNSEDDVITATLAYECLTSVPYNGAVAARFMEYFYDSAEFQSNLAYLKSPPPSYQQAGVDFLGGLELIQAKINNGGYANQYEFEAALQALIYSTHDGHLFLSSGILSLFSFGSQYQIASVSIDGVELPKVYIADHLFASQDPGSSNASAIATINGQNAADYLTQYSAANSVGGLEPHADWNSLFASPAQDIQGTSSIWNGGGTFYPGDTITFVLENGTQIGPDPFLAIFSGGSDGVAISTGGDFYNFFVLGLYPASYNSTDDFGGDSDGSDDSAASSTYGTSAATSAYPSGNSAATSTYPATEPTQTSWGPGSGYPENPVIVQPDLGLYGGGSLSGYFLEDYSLAVLSIPSFQEFGDAIGTFSGTVRDFIASSKAAGMEKFLIDLQQNYGGETLLAFDTFKQFFPEIDPYGGSRMRAHPSADIIGDQITTYWNGLNPDYDDWYALLDSEWLSADRIDASTNQNFTSWQQFFEGPQLNGDTFTSIQRYDLSNFLFDTLSTDDDEGFTVYGYGDNPVNTTQPYLAEDIIILTDGQCASTCSLFMEMMHHEAGVRTVVAGGRPSYGPMQAPGLTRGAAAYDVVDSLDADIALAQLLLDEDNQPSDFLPNRTTPGPGMSISYAQINLRDQIRQGETVPLQFTYEAANCRIFYTAQTFYNYTNLWRYAADAIYSNPAFYRGCASGSSETRFGRNVYP